jgi:hypothetical protein
MHLRIQLGSLLPSLFRNSPRSLSCRFMETDFSVYDVLTVETGLSEEPPLELLLGLRGRTVLSSRNGEAIDS